MLSSIQKLMPFFGGNRNSKHGNPKSNSNGTELASSNCSAILTQKNDTINSQSEVWQTVTRSNDSLAGNESSARITADEQCQASGGAGKLLSHKLLHGSSILLSFKRKSRDSLTEYTIDEDVTRGRERLKMPALSYRKNDKAPSDYHYVSDYIETQLLNIDRTPQVMSSCQCRKTDLSLCTSDCNCLAGLEPIYNSKGRLSRHYNFESPRVIYECNWSCKCDLKACKNAVIQKGCQVRLVLFKTKAKGWGVKTLERLHRGTFIGVYSGELISAKESLTRKNDTYLFNLSTTDIRTNQDQQQVEQYVCDANNYGNFTRFINHSCNPNTIGVRSYTNHQDQRLPYIAFFTNRDVDANQELTLNYGDNYWLVKCSRDKIYCLCKQNNCKFNKKTFPATVKAYEKAKQGK